MPSTPSRPSRVPPRRRGPARRRDRRRPARPRRRRRRRGRLRRRRRLLRHLRLPDHRGARRELDRTGAISLTRFFAGRIKRLMPQVLVVIAAVVVASSLLLAPVRARRRRRRRDGGRRLRHELAAVGERRRLLRRGRRRPAAGPLLVAGGRGAVLPRVAAAAARGRAGGAPPRGRARTARSPRCWRHRRPRRSPAPSTDRPAAPEQAYFSPRARAWELAVGGLLALALLRRRLGRAPRRAAAWAGAGAIARRHAAARRRDADAGRAGAAARARRGRAARGRDERRAGRCRRARWPRGPRASSGGSPTRGTSGTGRRWCSPRPCSARSHTGEGLAVTIASLVPALVTHRWIEEPLRRSKVHLRRPRAILVAAIAGPAAAVAVGRRAVGERSHRRAALSAGEAEGAGQLQRTGRIQESATALRPRPVTRARSRQAVRDGCLVAERGDQLAALRLRRAPAARHRRAVRRLARDAAVPRARARRAAPPLAAREPDQGGLPALDASPSSRRCRAARYPECDAWREHALRRIEREERPALVLAAGSAHHQVLDGGAPPRAASRRARAGGRLAARAAPAARRGRRTSSS